MPISIIELAHFVEEREKNKKQIIGTLVLIMYALFLSILNELVRRRKR